MSLRTSLPVQPHLYIGDSTGRPLDYGMVYFGQPNKDPEFYPIDIFIDEDKTVQLSQPVRTKGGFMNSNGDMNEVYASELTYSVKVLDRYGRQVFYKAEMTRTNTAGSVSTKAPYAGAVLRTQEERNADKVSVKDFGAKGDGTTDDTASIQLALNTAFSNYKSLYFPAGIYIVSNTVILPVNTGTENVIRGLLIEGDNAILAKYTAGYMFAPSNDDHIGLKIQNMSFKGGLSSPISSCINISRFYRLRITNCQFYRFINALGIPDASSGRNYIQTVYASMNTFHGCTHAVRAPRAYDFKFQNNIVEHGTHGIYIASDDNFYNPDPIINASTISNNVIEGMSGKPIYTGGCFGLEIDANYFEANHNYPDIDLTNGTRSYRGLSINTNQHQPTTAQKADVSYVSILLSQNKINAANISFNSNVTSAGLNKLTNAVDLRGYGNFPYDSRVTAETGLAIRQASYDYVYITRKRATHFTATPDTWSIVKFDASVITAKIEHAAIFDFEGTVSAYNSGVNLIGTTYVSGKLVVSRDVTGAVFAKMTNTSMFDITGKRTTSLESSGMLKPATTDPIYEGSKLSASVSGSIVSINMVDILDNSVAGMGQRSELRVSFSLLQKKSREISLFIQEFV